MLLLSPQQNLQCQINGSELPNLAVASASHLEHTDCHMSRAKRRANFYLT